VQQLTRAFVLVQYDQLFSDDDGHTRLREWFPLPAALHAPHKGRKQQAAADLPGDYSVHKGAAYIVRPKPPPEAITRVTPVSPGDSVEVFHDGGWWVGRATAVTRTQVTVVVPGEPEPIEAALLDIRNVLLWDPETNGWALAVLVADEPLPEIGAGGGPSAKQPGKKQKKAAVAAAATAAAQEEDVGIVKEEEEGVDDDDEEEEEEDGSKQPWAGRMGRRAAAKARSRASKLVADDARIGAPGGGKRRRRAGDETTSSDWAASEEEEEADEDEEDPTEDLDREVDLSDLGEFEGTAGRRQSRRQAVRGRGRGRGPRGAGGDDEDAAEEQGSDADDGAPAREEEAWEFEEYEAPANLPADTFTRLCPELRPDDGRGWALAAPEMIYARFAALREQLQPNQVGRRPRGVPAAVHAALCALLLSPSSL